MEELTYMSIFINLLKNKKAIYSILAIAFIILILYLIIQQSSETNSSKKDRLPHWPNVIDFEYDSKKNQLTILEKDRGLKVVILQRQKNKWDQIKTIPVTGLNDADFINSSPENDQFIVSKLTDVYYDSVLINKSNQSSKLPKNISSVHWLDSQNIIYSYKNQNLTMLNTVLNKWSVVAKIKNIQNIFVNENKVFITYYQDLDTPGKLIALDKNNKFKREEYNLPYFLVLPSPDNQNILFSDNDPLTPLDQNMLFYIYNIKSRKKQNIKGDIKSAKWIDNSNISTVYQKAGSDAKIVSYRITDKSIKLTRSKVISNFDFSEFKKVEFSMDTKTVFILNFSNTLYKKDI